MIEVNRIGEVVQIKMGRELNGKVLHLTSVYLIDGLLIDTGPSHTAEELAQALESEYLKLAVNTHYHEDHIGGNAILMRKFGIRILASRHSVPLINQVPDLYPARELVWGFPEPTEVGCLSETVETDRFRFEVIETLGHCEGHVALIERAAGWCFSGDLFVVPEPKFFRPSEEDLEATVRSMRRLADFAGDSLVLFTGPGDVVADGRQAFHSRIEYYRALSKRARELQKRGNSVAAIRDELFGGEGPWAEATGGDMSCEHLVRALLDAEI